MQINELVQSQRAYFNTHITRNITFRINQLQKLAQILKDNEQELQQAIYSDFKKSFFENYISELALIQNEIKYTCKNLRKWSRKKYVKTNLLNFPAKSYVIPCPLGVVLIIAPWNYPYNLSLIPAISAIAAGNTVVLKPSEIPVHTSHIMARLINNNFDPQLFNVIEGGVGIATELLEQKYDKIFFTGSTQVGKIVFAAAAKNLTPVTLELGGKSPTIFTEGCNLKMAVKRMIWAKFLNAGQTCISADYALVPSSLKEDFLKIAVAEIEQTHYSIANNNYVQIINEENMHRLLGLLKASHIYYGGDFDLAKRHIEPTIVTDVRFDDIIMRDEIFGPILPVIVYDDLDKVITRINTLPKPLACYVFTKDKKIRDKVLYEVAFGGGAVNDSVVHFTNNNLPFGGIAESGLGSYHGEFGFNTFTHYKGIIDKPTWFELNLKYYPRTDNKLKWIKRLLR